VPDTWCRLRRCANGRRVVVRCPRSTVRARQGRTRVKSWRGNNVATTTLLCVAPRQTVDRSRVRSVLARTGVGIGLRERSELCWQGHGRSSRHLARQLFEHSARPTYFRWNATKPATPQIARARTLRTTEIYEVGVEHESCLVRHSVNDGDQPELEAAHCDASKLKEPFPFPFGFVFSVPNT
jgi:hypothetical protein